MRRLPVSSIFVSVGLLLCLLVLAAASPLMAQSKLQRLSLGEVSFSVPSEFSLTSLSPDEVNLEDEAGTTRLRAFWWMPDEPLLGYDDIVSHEQVSVAGRQALLIHSRFPAIQRLKLAFDDLREDGRQFILALESDTTDFAKGSSLFVDIMESIRFAGSANPVAHDVPAETKATQSDPLGLVRQRFGNDCEAIDLPAWSHPTRDEMDRRPQVRLRWAALCEARRYPVFGLDVDYDPRGQTNDFFLPFYDDLLQANGRWPFAIIVPSQGLMIAVSGRQRNELNLDYQEAPEFSGAAPVPAEVAGQPVYLPSPETDDVRLWLGPMSFEAPAGWQAMAGGDDRTMRLASPDNQSEIIITLWPVDRPMPSDGVDAARFSRVAGARAQSLIQRIGGDETRHVFFEDPLGDGSRIAVTWRTSGGPADDLNPILELFYASLDRNRPAPGAPLIPTARPDAGDPFAGISMERLMQ